MAASRPAPRDKTMKLLNNQPDGFGVGCADLMQKGADGLFVRVYYPTQAHDQLMNWYPPLNANQCELMPENKGSYENGMKILAACMMPSIFGGLAKKGVAKLWARCCRQIPAAWQSDLKSVEGERLPVIVFSGGYAGPRFMYHGICSALVGAGFVVVSIEHGDKSVVWTYRDHGEVQMRYPQNGELKNVTQHPEFFNEHNPQRGLEILQTVKFVKSLADGTFPKENLAVGAQFDIVQNFAHKLDSEHIMLMGYSLGAPSCYNALLRSDPEHDQLMALIDRVVILDGTMFCTSRSDCEQLADTEKPFLFLNADIHYEREVEKRVELMKLCAHARMMTLTKTSHTSFEDFDRYTPKWMGAQGLDPILVDGIVAESCRHFRLDKDPSMAWPPAALMKDYGQYLGVPVTRRQEKKLDSRLAFGFKSSDADEGRIQSNETI